MIEASTVHFRVLGPLEVSREGTAVGISRPKQRLLLALLLLRANEVVPVDALVEALWQRSIPETAGTALHGLVSQLRKLLGSGRLTTRAPGYCLQVAADELDLFEFERLAGEARRSVAPQERRRLLEDALALWRGPPLQEFMDHELLAPELERLGEMRLVAVEELLDADLELGGHLEVVPELEALVAAHPYRERLRVQLMLALYRSGRQARALEVYRRGRQALAELGLEPTPPLQHLQQQILAQDERLVVAAPAAAAQAHGAEPAAGTPPVDVGRRTLIMLLCDLLGSAQLGELPDRELLRRLLTRYFGEARAVIERHGGKLEQFVGDAVMATFGLPVLQEDNGPRAARAAAELRTSLVTLNAELARDLGAWIDVRIEVASGELVARDVSAGRRATPWAPRHV